MESPFDCGLLWPEASSYPKDPEGLARFLDYAVADRYSFSV